MEYKVQYIDPDIKLSEFNGKNFKTEVQFQQHMLVWFISGETKIIQADRTFVFTGGDIFLIPRNHLATVVNNPKNGIPNKAVTMHLSEDRLNDYYTRHKTKCNAITEQNIYSFTKHPLLQSCLASLTPYFELGKNLPPDIATIKIEEAISIIREIDCDIDGMLAHFDDPGKIDLIDFMERNYMFNMTLERFGYLTGRSVATFRRDFEKSFNMKPQKWLTKKRLTLAHYFIAEKHRKANEIYLEVGFENLSHFSYAFKRYFGYSPTAIVSRMSSN